MIVDKRTSAEKSSTLLEKAHEEVITALEFNPNRQNTVLSSSFDHQMKVWDLRRPDLPILIYCNQSNPIECVRYNPVYDQLVLFSSKILLT